MELLKSISQTMEEAHRKNSADAFSQLGYDLAKLKDQVREKIQEQTMGAINAIVRKLESNQPLTPEEKTFVRLWVVGDAEGYVRMEQTLKEWLAEYQRLVGLIKDYAQRSGSVQEMVELHGVLEDAVKVADNVAHFLEDKERIQRFDEAINNLSSADNKLIADFLKAKLVSPDI